MRLIFHNFAWKILSLVVAFAIWIYVLSSSQLEVSKEVPIELDLPPGLVVSNDITDKVIFRLSGSKFFLRSVMNSRRKLVIDLKKAKAGPTYYSILSDSLQLPIGIRVLSISPTTIHPILEKVKTKNVPVRVRKTGKLPKGYRLIKLKAQPEIVRIRGPRSKVDRVREIRPPAVDLSDVPQNLKWEIPIKTNSPTIQFDEEVAPVLAVEVEPVGSKYRIVVNLQIQTDKRYKTDINKVALYVSGSIGQTQKLNSENIRAFVDLKNLGSGSYVRPVQVDLPKGVRLVQVVPRKIRVKLE